MKKTKKLPRFRSEKQERDFWLTHDATDYLDIKKARSVVFTELKPTTQAISLRLPESLLAEIKALANQRDVPYQSLMKIFLAAQVKKELG